MNCIDVKNLIVEFDVTNQDGNITSKKRVLDDISFSINEGDFLCILGKNGSGKSTLSKTFNALQLPTSGDVLVYGYNTKDENKVIDIRKLVGMAFQNPDNQIVASIVEEDIAFGLENIGIPPEEMRKRIDEAMKSLNILELKESMTSKLSGGQKQKISIAGILAMKSKIIVLDEPTSMLDKVARTELLDMAKKLNEEENITIILISHNIEEIMYATRVMVLDDGKIKIDDIPKNVLLHGDELKKYGIELPYVSKLANALKKKGLNYKGNETTIEEIL